MLVAAASLLFAAGSIGFAAAPALAADVPAASSAALGAAKGKMLVAADGARIASIYRLAADGAQVILDGRMVTVPNSTLAMVDGRVRTSLTRPEIVALP